MHMHMHTCMCMHMCMLCMLCMHMQMHMHMCTHMSHAHVVMSCMSMWFEIWHLAPGRFSLGRGGTDREDANPDLGY